MSWVGGWLDGVKTGRFGVKREVSRVIAFFYKYKRKPFRGFMRGNGRM